MNIYFTIIVFKYLFDKGNIQSLKNSKNDDRSRMFDPFGKLNQLISQVN